MECSFRRSHASVLIYVSVFVAVSLLFSTATEASTYDEFSSAGIDTGKWKISDPQVLFSQPGDGQLHFTSDNSAGKDPPPRGGLTSTMPFTAGFFSMDFNNFSSTNTSPGGQGMGSFAALGLGTKNLYVRMMRGRVVSEAEGYFEANYFDGVSLHVWAVFTDVTSGRLGLNYDGSAVSFFYDNESNGWQLLDTTGPDSKGQTVAVTPGWSSPPPLFISGTPGASGLTNFAVDKVEYSSVPEPASVLWQGTIGTEFTITGSGFGTKKGKTLLGTATLKIIRWADDSIQCQLTKALPPGAYDVTIKPQAKGSSPITISNGFTVEVSEIDSVNPTSGSIGDEITMNGLFFGTKKGKVTLGGKNCRVLGWTMDPLTGESEIQFVVPSGLSTGAKELKVTNGVGADRTDFTVE